VPTFRFHHEWSLDAPAPRVFDALADVERYAAWWPQVRTVERIDEHSARTAVRSFLPYTLDLVLRREIEDEASRALRVALSGDLEGWSQWQVDPAREPDGGTVATFDQVAVVTPALLGRNARLPPRSCGPTTRG
jgi:hypothetical protein